MGITLDLRIEHDAWNDLPDCEILCQTAADATGLSGVVDLLLTDDASMKILNREWRGKHKPTDVLSFPAEAPADGLPPEARFLGDIAIGYEITAEDAKAAGKPLSVHLSHLIIHGLLHLVGHDHINDTDAEKMESLEISALKRLGYDNPYANSADF